MKAKTIVIIVIGTAALLVGLHFALNTDWMALIKSLHPRPQH